MAPFRNSRAASLPAKLSRSWLLASAADEANFAPALASEADSVVFDMEDAVKNVEPGGFSDKVFTLDNRKIYKSTF